MTTPFRNDVDALKTRLTSLDEELATLRTKAAEYDSIRERLAQVEREHSELRDEINARTNRRAAPYLDTLRIASPCNESWDAMIGDDRTRFCAKCEKNVHNVSEMTRDEAEAFLESVAGAACIRMYQRTDGTVLTADCPVGMRKKRVKRLFLATVGGGLAMAAGALAMWRIEESLVMGKMEAHPMVGEPAVEVMGDIDPGPPVTQGTMATPPRDFATPPPPRKDPAPELKDPWKTPKDPNPARSARPTERLGW